MPPLEEVVLALSVLIDTGPHYLLTMSVVTPPSDDGRYRWAVNTGDDHSGTLYIFTFLGFTYSSLTFITRIYIKWHVLGLDDAAILAAQVLGHATLHCIYAELTHI